MEKYIEAAADVIRSGRYLNGPKVAGFERMLAASCGAAHAVAVSCGLDALRLILKAYIQMGRLEPGDEVIVPANTFIATFLAVSDCGLVPVAADVRTDDFCIDPERLPLSPRTKAVIIVHLYGNPCWNSAIFDTLKRRGIIIIEDNAQAIGAAAAEQGFNGSNLTGNLADAAAFSFYPAKNVGALGDAGGVTTSDAELASMVRKLANYGSEDKYHHAYPGGNCRMEELHAAMLTINLPLAGEIAAERARRAALYDSLITSESVKLPHIFSDRSQVWHQYVVRSEHRDALRDYLDSMGIATEIHYPVPCHLQQCYSRPGSVLTPVSLHNAERLATEILSLPIAGIADEDIARVAEAVNRFTY